MKPNSNILKQTYVNQWWATCLERRSQLDNAKKYRDRGLLVEVKSHASWYSRVDTDALYLDHIEWAKNRGLTKYAEELTKTGFMQMFYKASGAERTRARTRTLSGNKTIRYVASFKPYEHHAHIPAMERS